MKINFEQAAILGSCLSRDYSEKMFRLLSTYDSISASEAASRTELHIRTVQEFLEDLSLLGITKKEEVYEGKRPYFRYRLEIKELSFHIDFSNLNTSKDSNGNNKVIRIREKKNAKVRFTTSRNLDYITNVIVWIGEGRSRLERKLNLSLPQGKFLIHLPFPEAPFMTVEEIMEKAGVQKHFRAEITDIINLLIEYEVIETG